MELKEFAKEMVEKSRKLADDIEIFIISSKSLEYEMQGKELVPSLMLDQSVIGIRVLKDGMMGSSSITRLDLEEGMLAVKKALCDMRYTDLKKFAKIKSPPELDTFDNKIYRLFDRPYILRDLAEQIQHRLYDEPRAKITNFEGKVAAYYSERLIATKRGMSFSKHTQFYVSAEINSVDVQFYVSTLFPKDVEPLKSIAVEAYRQLPKAFVTPAQLDVKGKEVDIVIDPVCFEAIIRTLLGEKFYGSSKMQGLSGFNVGDRVADKRLTVIDSGNRPQMIFTSPTDDEGTISQDNVMIKKGVMKSVLYDLTSARKAGKRPTGNGLRTQLQAESLSEAPVKEGLRNIEIMPGTKPLAKMLQGIKLGVYVKGLLGLHCADKTRASFAAGIFAGKTIEKGKYARLLKPGSWNLSGHLFDMDGRKGMLRKIELSKEAMNTGSAIIPWAKVRLSF